MLITPDIRDISQSFSLIKIGLVETKSQKTILAHMPNTSYFFLIKND